MAVETNMKTNACPRRAKLQEEAPIIRHSSAVRGMAPHPSMHFSNQPQSNTAIATMPIKRRLTPPPPPEKPDWPPLVALGRGTSVMTRELAVTVVGAAPEPIHGNSGVWTEAVAFPPLV